MASEPRLANRRVDRDGVTITYTGAARAVGAVLACALAVLGIGAWLILRSARRPEVVRTAEAPKPGVERSPTPPKATPDRAPKEHPAATAAEQAAPVPMGPPQDAAPQEAAPPQEEEQTYTLLKPGEHAGLGVFPPPGTKPIKRGIVVPDDFELPPGYVRHYQTTDDGRRLPPILMFHPDYAGADANGNPLPVPEDRIVPPDMAPPGMPVEILDPDRTPTSASAAPGRAR